jgi:hypothetical protein
MSSCPGDLTRCQSVRPTGFEPPIRRRTIALTNEEQPAQPAIFFALQRHVAKSLTSLITANSTALNGRVSGARDSPVYYCAKRNSRTFGPQESGREDLNLRSVAAVIALINDKRSDRSGTFSSQRHARARCKLDRFKRSSFRRAPS